MEKIAETKQAQDLTTAPNNCIHMPPHAPPQSGVLAGKRIVFVHASLELGGAERQSLHLARYLACEGGAHVQMWGFEGAGQLARMCDESGIPWRIVPLRWSPSRMKKLLSLIRFAWLLRGTRPDVLLPYTVLPSVVCGIVWPWTGARLCVWNQRAVVRDIISTSVQKWAVARSHLFISNSRHGAEHLINTFGLNPQRIQVVANGVDIGAPQADRASWRRRLEVRNETFVACMVANLSKYKDHETLLRAWLRVVEGLRARGEDAVLILAGRFANTQERLKALAFDLDLGKSVLFLGQVDDIAGLLGAVDLAVYSSRSEGSPNGVLECMAAGLPVVGTDEPGVREAVGPHGYSYLVPPGDAHRLAARIIDLSVDPTARAILGAKNRARIQSEFSVRRMCEETSSFIARALIET